MITPEHIEQFRSHGYVVVDQLLDEADLERAQRNVREYFPTWDEVHGAPTRFPHITGTDRVYLVDGPFVGSGLNRVSTHPELCAFARQVIGCDEIFLEQSQIRAEYYGMAEYEQLLHLDFGCHSLTYPRSDSTYEMISCIVYYTDVTAERGPTHVVSRQATRHCEKNPFAGRTGVGRSPFGGSNVRWQLTRDEFPEVYAQERPVLVPAGGALIFSMSTWHRASRFSEPGERLSHTVSFRAAAHKWAGFDGWSFRAPEEEMIQFISRCTPEERALVGFPLPGDPYWNEETLRGVAARYPQMDMTPYRTTRQHALRSQER